MRIKILIGTLLVAGVAAATVAALPTRKAAVVSFLRPTIIAGNFVQGPVVFEHDDGKMARGEPCTTIYEYDRKNKARGDVIVAFMCTPKHRPLATKFEAVNERSSPAGPDRLLEYQFAGDTEGHGVPR